MTVPVIELLFLKYSSTLVVFTGVTVYLQFMDVTKFNYSSIYFYCYYGSCKHLWKIDVGNKNIV